MQVLVLCTVRQLPVELLVIAEQNNITFHCVFDISLRYLKHRIFEVVKYIESDKEIITTMSSLCDMYTYDNVISLFENDLLYAAIIREKYNIKGQSIESVLCYRDKTIMKKILQEANIRVPNFKKINELDDIDTFQYPFVIKPIDLSGARDIYIIKTDDDLENAKHKMNLTKINYEMEEYIDGDLYHVDGIYYKGKVILCHPSKYVTNCANTSFENIDCSYIIEESELSNKLNTFAINVIDTLQKKQPEINIVFHLELFYNGREIVFCEVGCRVGGNCQNKNWINVFNINLWKEYVKILFGLNLSDNLILHKPTIISGTFNVPAKDGLLVKLPYTCNIEGIKEYISLHSMLYKKIHTY